MRYDAVLFDAGETLIRPKESFGSVYARVLAPLGASAPAGAFERAVRASWAELDRRFPEGADRYRLHPGGEEGYWREFAEGALRRVLGRAPDPELLETALGRLRDTFFEPDTWRVHEDVRPTLEALKRIGVALAVVSNWDSRLPALLQRLDLSSYFDAVAVSSEVGVEKPHPGLFLHALERLGVPPERALHVGDVPELDARGARAAGLDSRIVDRLSGAEDGERIATLAVLPELVTGRRG